MSTIVNKITIGDGELLIFETGGTQIENDNTNKMLPFIFDIPLRKLHYITSNNLNVLSDLLKQNIVLMGIDSETKPNFVPKAKRNKTSLLQIAMRSNNHDENVVIIDLLEILSSSNRNNNNNNNNNNELDTILKNVFEDEHVIKIGQGLKQDLNELSQSYPTMSSFSSVRGILDTNVLIRNIHKEIPSDLSLKKMVALYLNSNMQKRQQKSNWALRPLKDVQIMYAALDALVLLRLYDTILCEAEEKNDFDIKDIIQNYSNDMNNNQMKKRKNNKEDTNNEYAPIYNKEIPCSIVDSTGTHTYFEHNDNQQNEILSLIFPNKKHRQQKIWKPLHVYHGRKNMMIGMNKKDRDKI